MNLLQRAGRRTRLFVGLAVSAVFVVATLARVDLAEVGPAIGRVDPRGLILAVALVLVELGVRAVRWRRLLQPFAAVPLPSAAAYLAIGYLANTILPARLGDLARAFLAGRAFGVPRLTVLGTVVVERLADGGFILGVVVLLGLALASGGSLTATALWLAALAVVGSGVLVAAVLFLRRAGGGALRTRVRAFVDRVLEGADAIRTPRGFGQVSALTAAAFSVAVVMFNVVATAAGVELSLAQAALAMGGVALSMAVPAAPGSIGTYEFAGVSILTSFGLTPETALVTVAIVHLVATVPLALTGVLAAWRLHFHVSELADDSEPSLLAPSAVDPDGLSR